MPLIYRAMTRVGNRPLVGATARSLGVRVPQDIAAPSGVVEPATGGMSVAPSWRELPPHRIPRRLASKAPEAAGNDADACWRMGDGPFEPGPVAEGLMLHPDRPSHGVVGPSDRMTLEAYRSAMAATRDLWRIDED